MKAVFVGFLLSLGSTNNVHICGAVLTSSNTAITAAHCVFGKIGRVNFSIRAGSSYLNSGGEMHYVSYVSIHPNYNSNNQDYDIAILFLKSLLRFGRTIRPVDLPIFEQRVADNTPAVVTGYGAVYEGGNAEWRMRATIVRVVGHKKCEKIYHGNMVTERMLCAGGGKEDACEGDSGGPLVANNTLIGIVSWGTACGAIGIPGIYTNVMKLLSFLRIFIHE